MLRRWGDLLPLMIQIALLGPAFAFPRREVWLAAFALAACLNLWAWLHALSRRRHILDTPTSRIASAAQGYVELIGSGRPLPDQPVLSPHRGLPCLWYHHTLERRRGNEWEVVSQSESNTPFLLDDGSGVCELPPQGAAIVTRWVETRTEGHYRHTEKVLLTGDSLYALGDFRSIGPGQERRNRSREVGELLGDWKQDQENLHHRFDLDGNGEIGEREWQLAQLAAGREVDRRHQEASRRPVRHVLRQPAGGGTWLISNLPPEHLGARYGRFSVLSLTLLLASLAGFGWAWDRV